MNELFVNIKVDREERPDVDAVYMDAVVALSGQGGWPMTVFLTPDGEPFFGGTYYPPEPRHGMPAFRQVLAAIAEAYRDRRDDVASAGGHARRRDRASRAHAAVARAAHGGAARRRGARPPHAVRPAVGRLRPRAEVPARVDDRVPAPPRRVRPRSGHARRHARRRDVRPRRRRLPPLLGRRAVARAALREDALRQRAARAGLPARLAFDARGQLPRDRRADDRVLPPRAPARGRRLRVGAGRGHRRRRRPHLHVGAARGSARGGDAPAVRARPLHHPRRPHGRGARGAPRVRARNGRSRCATTRRSPAGTG